MISNFHKGVRDHGNGKSVRKQDKYNTILFSNVSRSARERSDRLIFFKQQEDWFI